MKIELETPNDDRPLPALGPASYTDRTGTVPDFIDTRRKAEINSGTVHSVKRNSVDAMPKRKRKEEWK